MKTIILSLIISFTSLVTSAQDYGKLSLLYMQNKPEDAKKEIDALMANPKAQNKAEAFLWKFKVYSELYADSNLYAKYPDADVQAMEALEKYKSLDNSLKMIKEEGARGVGLLYNTSFSYGQKNFRDTNWENSYKYFKIADQMGDFIMKTGLSKTNMTLDTVTVFLTGAAAQNAHKYDDAASNYRRLADLNIGGAEYEDVYRFLTDYYMRQKDTANFSKYLSQSKQLYPNSKDVWAQMEMQNMTQSSSLSDIISKYKQEESQGTLNEEKYINYAETFAGPTKDQLEALDSTQQLDLKKAAADAYSKAFSTNPNGLYAFNAGVVNYNIYSTLDERYYTYRGENASLKAKRTEIEKEEMKYADTAALWLEKAYIALKAKQDRTKSETNSLNRTVDYLTNIYLWRRDKSKGVNTKDYDMYDAKYKQYDVEHNMYK